MKRFALIILAITVAGALAACSLPGRAFPGGPSPWLPAGAPDGAYPSPAATAPAPAAATGLSAGSASEPLPAAANCVAETRECSGTMRADPAGFTRVSSQMIDSLLVVCTGNICRSPMGEALFAHTARAHGKALDVASAGTGALIGYPPPREAIELMAERDLDISGHRAQQVTGEIARRYELILVMEASHQHYLEANWPMLKGRVHQLLADQAGGVTDPYGGPKDIYRQSLVQIDQGIEQWSKMLL